MAVTLRQWADEDLPLLRRLNGDPAMMEHLGGAESEAKIAERQERYARPDSDCFAVLDDERTAVGWVGFWEREWAGETVHEVGWSVLPEHQGRGYAGAAARAIVDLALAAVPARAVHAFPSVDNPPSNAVCERAGMAWVAAVDFEYPPGHTMRCNDWVRRGGA